METAQTLAKISPVKIVLILKIMWGDRPEARVMLQQRLDNSISTSVVLKPHPFEFRLTCVD